MKKAQNKNKFTVGLVSLALGLLTAVGLFSFAPESAQAGGENIDTTKSALCYKDGRGTQVDTSLASEVSGCTGSGGVIVRPGNNLPVEICIQGNKFEMMEDDTCLAVGGNFQPANSPLPEIPNPSSGAGSTGTTQQTVIDPTVKTSGKRCGAEKVNSYDPDPVDPVIDLGCKGLGNPILDILFAFMRFLSLGAGLVVIGSMIVAGIQYTASRGDPQATAAALKRITSNVSALAFFIFTYAILNWLVPNGVLK